MEQTEYQKILEGVKEREEEARISMVWTMFLRQHREVAPVDANYYLALRAFGNSPEDQAAFDLQSLELLYGDPDFRDKLTYTTESQENAKLIDKIIALLQKARSPEQLDAERKRMQYWTNQQLEKRLAELTRLKELERNNTREQLHKMSRRQLNVQPELPAEYSREILVKKTDGATLRKLIRIYGHEAVTKRLNGEN